MTNDKLFKSWSLLYKSITYDFTVHFVDDASLLRNNDHTTNSVSWHNYLTTEAKNMSERVMADADDIKTMKTSILSMEKAIVELAVLQKESSKREERNQAESAKREERLYKRMDRVEEQVRINTNLLWKFTGAITAIVTIITVATSVYGTIQP